MREDHVENREPSIPEAVVGSEPTLAWVAAILLRERRRLLWATVIGAGLGLLVALLRPASYTTSFSFTPQSPDGAPAGGLANLAGQFGVSLGALSGDARPPEFYADLVLTREVLVPVARARYQVGAGDSPPLTLAEILEEEDRDSSVLVDKMVERLRKDVVRADVATRTTGVVTVEVTTPSPAVSLAIAEHVLVRLNEFNLTTAQQQAAAERQFLEGRLSVSRQELRRSEDALQVFLQQNRQVANSPELTFRMERLQREVELQQQLVTGLAQQYEDARIKEVRDTPVLALVERPSLAARPNPRKRALVTFAGLSLGFLLASASALGQAALKRGTGDPAETGPGMLESEVRQLRSSQ